MPQKNIEVVVKKTKNVAAAAPVINSLNVKVKLKPNVDRLKAKKKVVKTATVKAKVAKSNFS